MDTKKIKVLFLTSSLSGGGAEHVVINLLRFIDKKRFSVQLALLRQEGELLNRLPEDVPTVSLGMQGEKIGREIGTLVRSLQRVVRDIRPDIVFSFMWEPNVINLLANFFSPRTGIILSERVAIHDNLALLFGAGVKRLVALMALKYLYRRADYIIAVSEGLRSELLSLGNSPNKVSVIHNPLNISLIDRLKEEEIDIKKPFILFAGRFNRQKNIPLLLNVFKRLSVSNDLVLVLLGKGEDQANLKDLVDKLNLADRVIFKGFSDNPYKYMRRASVFVLPSAFEGFPNVLLEAMACGAPVVSTKCPFGPEEIIEDGVSGLLVPVGNLDAMEIAISSLLDNHDLRETLISGGYRRVRDFDIESIVLQYEDIISRAYSKKHCSVMIK